MLVDSITGERRPEARPTRPRVVLGVRVEELRATTGAGIDAAILVVGVRAGERPLSTLVAGDLVGERRESLTQFGVGRRGLAHAPIMARQTRRLSRPPSAARATY
mgnify:CR=1 FL=1